MEKGSPVEAGAALIRPPSGATFARRAGEGSVLAFRLLVAGVGGRGFFSGRGFFGSGSLFSSGLGGRSLLGGGFSGRSLLSSGFGSRSFFSGGGLLSGGF